MRFLIAAFALLIFGVLGWYSGVAKEVQGELRCEGAGAHPDADIGRIVSRGLTLRDW